MRIGKFRHRIIIQQPEETRDSAGGVTVTWGTFATIWAAVEPLRGREFWAAKEQQTRVTARIRIRYLSGVTPKMRILFVNRVYLINAVIDQEERHTEIQLMCEELVAT